jgi:hypothetical protein
MVELGYLKDVIAVFFFTFILVKLYYLNYENMKSTKYELMIYIGIAFLADLFYSIFSKAHTQSLGFNFYSIIYFILVLLFIIYFIYFNLKYLKIY